ncbi:glycosyltransferase family 2 protein [Fundicoccus sp. Sow4_D5]|uniref:glycosyltransferase family 2 protein n=1 Tax=Fundicoccus sp. Sow4_D5 TaxID=3438782 RepID=UPI003F929BC7
MIGNASAVVNLFKARRRKLLDNILKHPYYFPVSIIVPAFNESFTILGTVDHLLHLDYEIYEIIIVDDGSTDDTATKIIDTYHMEKQEGPLRVQVPSKPIQEIYTSQFQKHRITLVRKENGRSKADAVNAGINVATYPYFITMDADEILQTDALKNSARLVLEDENVVAVGGLLNISNGVTFKNARAVDTPLTRNPVAAMQSLEYTRAFMGSRVFNDSFNGNLNVSGG